MINKFSIGDISWVDIESPTKNEIEHLCDELDIPDFIKDELLPKTLRSKVTHYDGGFYLVLHFPYPGSSRDKSQEIEVDFLVHKDYLVTLHYTKVNSVKDFHSFLEKSITDRAQKAPANGGVLFYEFLKIFYDRIHQRLADFNLQLLQIEKEIYEEREDAAVKSISAAKRTLLDFRQALRFHKDILVSLQDSSKEIFGKNYGHHVELLVGEYNKLENILSGHKEILSDLHMTNDSLLTTKTNNIMKKLTIMAFITFPLTLLAGIFGMNTDSTPIIGLPNDFWMIITLMILGVFGMLVYFSTRKWL